jgi:hypothetical protein
VVGAIERELLELLRSAEVPTFNVTIQHANRSHVRSLALIVRRRRNRDHYCMRLKHAPY